MLAQLLLMQSGDALWKAWSVAMAALVMTQLGFVKCGICRIH